MSNTYLWTGAQNTDWNNPNNWNVVNGKNVTTQTGVPGATDNILIMSGNSLNQAGYTYNGDANAMNNAVKNMTPTLSGSTPVTVANVTLGGNGGPATLITGSTPFTVTGTLEDPQSAGFINAQGGSYSLQGTNIHIVHLNWGTGGNVSYGTGSMPANVTVDWMSGAGQNDNGNHSVITVTKGYDVDNSGTPVFRTVRTAIIAGISNMRAVPKSVIQTPAFCLVAQSVHQKAMSLLKISKSAMRSLRLTGNITDMPPSWLSGLVKRVRRCGRACMMMKPGILSVF